MAESSPSRNRLHALFEAGMIIKGSDSVIETTLGFLFYFLSSQKVNEIILGFFGNELTEQPRDAVLNFFLHGFNGISPSAQSFWAFIFLAHGLTKIFLVLGLYRKKIWVYPVAAGAFALFALYQIYHLFYSPSALVELLTTFDFLFIYLILNEYRYQTRTI